MCFFLLPLSLCINIPQITLTPVKLKPLDCDLTTTSPDTVLYAEVKHPPEGQRPRKRETMEPADTLKRHKASIDQLDSIQHKCVTSTSNTSFTSKPKDSSTEECLYSQPYKSQEVTKADRQLPDVVSHPPPPPEVS